MQKRPKPGQVVPIVIVVALILIGISLAAIYRQTSEGGKNPTSKVAAHPFTWEATYWDI